MGPDSPLFVSGAGRRLVCSENSDEADFGDLQRRGAKLGWEQFTLPRYVRRTAPAFLHMPWYEGGLFIDCPLVLTVMDLDTLLAAGRYSPHFRLYYNTLLRRGVARAAVVITPSEATARDVRRHLPAARRVEVVPLGVDEAFRTADRRLGEQTLEQLGVTAQHVVACGSGTSARKNVGTLVRALDRIARDGADVALVVTGDAELDTTSLLGADSPLSVHLTGVLSSQTLAGLYAACTVAACPSLYEGFGFAVVEAMASGAPVVSSDAGSLPEVAGSAAALVPPRDLTAWASTLGRLFESPEERDEMRRAGRLASADFSWQRTAEMTATLYREVA